MVLRTIFLVSVFTLFTAQIIFEDEPLCKDPQSTCVPVSSCLDEHAINNHICDFNDQEEMVCCRSAVPLSTVGQINSTTTRPVTSKPADSVLPTDCGQTSTLFYNRIIGGEKVDADVWPWLVLLYIDDFAECAGSFISQNWILTASHCVFTDSAGRMLLTRDRLKIRRGVTNLTSPAKFLSVADIVPHPRFGGAEDYANDVALVKLKPEANLDEKVNPICVPGSTSDQADPTREDMTGRMAFVAGWGRTNQDSRKGSDVLLQTQVMIWSDTNCRAAYRRIFRMTNTSFCAGVKEGGKDACQGDSGGPLMLPGLSDSQDRFYAVGTISFGAGCGNANYPGGYTKNQLYREWIEETIKSTK